MDKQLRIVIDVQPYSWTITEAGLPTDLAYLAHSARLLKLVKRTDCKVLVPAPLVTEVVTGCRKNEAKKQRFRDLFADGKFTVVAFDEDIAWECGDLMADIFERKGEFQMQGSNNRQCVKVDAMHLATAIYAEADWIVSGDKFFKRFETPQMKVLTVLEAIALLERRLGYQAEEPGDFQVEESVAEYNAKGQA